MEDDDDIFGFNALTDMFDVRTSAAPSHGAPNAPLAASQATVEPKRLDVAAMSRFWWSERRLNEFRRGPHRHTKEYHHIAAKFDGMRVDGGLGSAFLVPRHRSESSGRVEDGGVLWIQAHASDSNAQARRKKEFQDITNRLHLRDRQDALKTPMGSSKSTGTVFLSMNDILDAKETRVQNTVQGIMFTLRSGALFEMAFMPGPFFDTRNRDEMLEAFTRQQVEDVFSPDSSPQAATVTQPSRVPPTSRASSRASSPNARVSQPTSREQTPQSSPSVVSATTTASLDPEAARKANRELIRRYVQVEKGTADAITLAKKIYSSTEYHIGPLATHIPNFSSDSAYRARTCDALKEKIRRLNQGWARNEQERELHTRARCGKTGNDILQYTDTITLEPMPPSLYQERYMEFVKAEQPETHPVIRKFEPRVINPRNSPQQVSRSLSQASLTNLSPSTTSSDEDWKVFGVDLRQSALVDSSLISKWQAMPLLLDEDMSGWQDLVDNSFLSDARNNFQARVSDLIHRLPAKPTIPSQRGSSTNSIDHSALRQSANRRRNLDQPSFEDVCAQFDSAERSPGIGKRRRSDGDASPTSGRRRRRQSLVGTLNSALFGEEKTEESSPLSSNNGIEPLDKTCPLCCDSDAVVVMKPCNHRVCRTCWGRLVQEGTDTRICPWDRAEVIER